MAQSRVWKTLLVGSCLIAFGGSAAWSIGRGGAPAGAPSTNLLTAATPVAWDIPATRNDAVDGWIGYLSGRNADNTRLWMERSGKYAPLIRAELKKRGMPEDLQYLAFIESGFTPRAYSSAAASGIWQFVASTGRRLGLEVNSEVDERRDPLKSTNAALDYLQNLYDEFGSWYLAAAAYNSGDNRIARVMREHTGSTKGTDADFWEIAPYLPRETRNYVPLMLAAGYVNKQPEEHGFDNVAYQDPLKFEVAWVPGGTPLSVVAKAAGVTDSVVNDLNPQLMKGRTPSNRGWAVRIPQGTRVSFDENFATSIAEWRATAPRPTPQSHKRSVARHVSAATVHHRKTLRTKGG